MVHSDNTRTLAINRDPTHIPHPQKWNRTVPPPLSSMMVQFASTYQRVTPRDSTRWDWTTCGRAGPILPGIEAGGCARHVTSSQNPFFFFPPVCAFLKPGGRHNHKWRCRGKGPSSL